MKDATPPLTTSAATASPACLESQPQAAEPHPPTPSQPALDLDPLPELLPVRMLNAFTYCPRLGYLEWVQGEWADNLDTREGTFGHRNIDKPSRGMVPAAADQHGDADSDNNGPQNSLPGADVIHARSLMLSAPGERLVAKLDLLELDGQVATPVDYKRGKVPDIPEGAYEPERVQICAQALILRENGFECREGVIYYIASRRRVAIPIEENLVARTRQLIAEFRTTAALRRLPPPLEDSPKCPRCSLVGICLPDEVNHLRHVAPRGDLTPSNISDRHADRDAGLHACDDDPTSHGLRRLVPARDDALPLYLQGQGLSLCKSGEQLLVKEKSELRAAVRLLDVSQVCVFGSVHVTEPALREIITRGVPVCHFSYGGWFYAITSGLVHKNVELRIQQYAAAADPVRALSLARQFVAGKIRNGRTLLRRHLPDGPERDKRLDQLQEYASKAEQSNSLESLLGIEGSAAKTYFSGFAALLDGKEKMEIEGRNRRPPRDPVNALLSFLYALLVKELTVAVQSVGFDPMLGVYHQPRYGRPSLALDLAEEFRPLIADSTVLMLVNNQEVAPSSFVRRAGAVALTDAGRRAVLAAFERRLNQEITHPLFGYRACYRRILEVQARLLARTLLGELPEYPSFLTR